MFREKNRHATAAMPHTAVPRDAPLAIDTANMYRPAGADGVDAADLAVLADPLARAHQALTERTRAASSGRPSLCSSHAAKSFCRRPSRSRASTKWK